MIASVLLGIAGAAAARLAATASVLGREVSEGRRSAVRDRKPFWQRYYLDFLALALSGLIYWLTVRTGFSAVVNPDSNPTLSLSVYMFLDRRCSGSERRCSWSACGAASCPGSRDGPLEATASHSSPSSWRARAGAARLSTAASS